ncbi:MAG: nucleoside triphosphate pyrophosphohydrolase [Gammaproteobacteria bacterium]
MPAAITELIELMKTLRAPSGCPWDRAQTFETLVPHTIEEVYEVADAIERGAFAELAGELGDLLFQVVFYAQIASELGHFDFDVIARQVTRKLRARHPHVFGSEPPTSAAAQSARWDAFKAEERRLRNASSSEIDDVPLALPGLTRAAKLQKRAARVGFDWVSVAPVFDKVAEELVEIRHAYSAQAPAAELHAELGDLLFATANLARHLGLDPESAARGANAKFERRFRHIEASLAERGLRPSDVGLSDLDRLWDEAKARGL